jgi:hypothetical protein
MCEESADGRDGGSRAGFAPAGECTAVRPVELLALGTLLAVAAGKVGAST